jgi:outer membrane receptor protein involved in Fe transport
VSATLTGYFNDGYALQAEDVGDTRGICIANGQNASAANTTFQDGVTPVLCTVKSFWDFDLHGSYQVRESIQVYADVINLFDRTAPYDPTTYGGYNYNSTFNNAGIFGRTFRVGLRATF